LVLIVLGSKLLVDCSFCDDVTKCGALLLLVPLGLNLLQNSLIAYTSLAASLSLFYHKFYEFYEFINSAILLIVLILYNSSNSANSDKILLSGLTPASGTPALTPAPLPRRPLFIESTTSFSACFRRPLCIHSLRCLRACLLSYSANWASLYV
jgi:hypothetical protein